MKLCEANIFKSENLEELVAKVQESAQLLTRGSSKKPLWWRGQAQLEWDVRPSLYREGFAPFERDMTRRFMSGAAVRHGNVPDKDYISWLCLMQHYRLPTRLLDWTESALVAAYFAIDKHPDKSGAVWGLCPSELNESEGDSDGEVLRTMQVERSTSWFGMSYSAAEPVVRAAFQGSGREPPQQVFAIPTNHFDLRQLVQQSTFTVHGTERPLDDFDECNRFLVRIEIPSGSKQILNKALTAFGINESYMFPDLERLANEIRARYESTS